MAVYDFCYGSDPKSPGGSSGSAWHKMTPPVDLVGNLFGQITVASVHMMLYELYQKGVSLNSAPWAVTYTDFKARAIEAADYIIDKLTEISTTTGKKILINTRQNPYIVGFGLYWWVKYIAPLKPSYGTILMQTAESILENFPQGDDGRLIQSCWSGIQESGIPDRKLPDPDANYLCRGCRQIYRDDGENNRAGEFLIHTSGAGFLAAAAWIEKRRAKTKKH